MNIRIKKEISSQLLDYEFEVFISDIIVKYYLDFEGYKECKCLLVTKINNDFGIDAILFAKDKDNNCKNLLLQISKGSKKIDDLKEFMSEESLQKYNDIIDRNYKIERIVVTLKNTKINIKDTNINRVISGKMLYSIIEDISNKYDFIENDGYIKQDFINFIVEKTSLWNNINRVRISKESNVYSKKSFCALRNFVHISSLNIENYKEYRAISEYRSSLFDMVHSRIAIQNYENISELDKRIEIMLDDIYYNNTEKLKSEDFINLKKLLKYIYSIIDEIYKVIPKHMAIEVTAKSKYLAINIYDKKFRKKFRSIANFSYCFSRKKESYLFSFYCELNKNIKMIAKDYNILITEKINANGEKIKDCCNLRGNSYIKFPDLSNDGIKKVMKIMIIESINKELSI